MIIYIENLRESIQLLGFGKIAGYKINTQKSTIFLYASYEQCKIEI